MQNQNTSLRGRYLKSLPTGKALWRNINTVNLPDLSTKCTVILIGSAILALHVYTAVSNTLVL